MVASNWASNPGGIAERLDHLLGPGAGRQIFLRAGLAEPQRQRLDVGDQRVIAARLGIGEQGREGAADQFGLGAALDRLEPRVDPGLGGEAGEQGLGEAVDRLDAQPPGVSSTRANKRRARCSAGGSFASPSANRSWRSATSGIRTQAASRAAMRLAISAAPALVKVRHRIAPGSTCPSSRRSTRAVSTWVLPVPAEADKAACATGSEARS